ncbi:MAG: hypothetical protein IJA62_02315 [Ruminococcus sp.]|nr:hypothetical protein [Ruminococcus sp.]
MMKRIFAIVLIVMMVFALAACDGGSKNTNETSPSNSAQVPADAQKLETNLWTLSYDAVWTYEEDDLSDDEEYSSVTLTIPEGDDSYVISADISASIEDPEDFRSYLDSYGFDAYEYAENNAYDLVNIGGVDCLMQEGNYWGEPCLRYFGRVENANATVLIVIMGEYEDAKVDTLLAGLSFNLTDIGNVDCPWPWNGEHFSAQDASVKAGEKTLSSKWIPFDESLVTSETFDHKVEVVGDKAYVITGGVLKQFAFDGKKLTFEKDVELEGEYEYITADKNGELWLSAFSEDLALVVDGEVVATYGDTDNVVMSPDGTWGISYFTSAECEKITIGGNNIDREPITFEELDTISEIFVDEKNIYVCGYALDESGHKVFVYDTDGNLQKILTDEDGEGLGSITYFTSTEDGYLGLDANMREVILWDADGKYVGAADDSDLFSTGYPWFCDGTITKDGNILVLLTDKRADNSAMELIAFTLGGF